MEFFSGVFFSGVYVFSMISICRWVYLAYAHDGAGAYFHLSEQKNTFFLNRSAAFLVRTHFELVSILVSFIIFLYALCVGFSHYFSWIPEHYHLTLGDGSTIPLSIVLSCFAGICSSVVFGKWIFIGICSYWEKRALAEQSMLYFEIIRQADNSEALNQIKKKILETVRAHQGTVTPHVVSSRLELCTRVIDLRIKEINDRQA